MKQFPRWMRRPGTDSFVFDGFASYTADGGANSCFVYSAPDR